MRRGTNVAAGFRRLEDNERHTGGCGGRFDVKGHGGRCGDLVRAKGTQRAMRLQMFGAGIVRGRTRFTGNRFDALRGTDFGQRREPGRLRIGEQRPERIERHGQNGQPGSEPQMRFFAQHRERLYHG